MKFKEIEKITNTPEGTLKPRFHRAIEIMIMLCRSILSIVLVASLIALLATYWAIDIWLSDFAYRTNINPLVFLLSAASVMIVAIGTVTLQSYKTAQADPSQSLRYE